MLAVLVFAAAFVNAPAKAQQYVVNGDFETGDFTGWTTVGVGWFLSLSANSGCCAAGVNTSGSTSPLAQTVFLPSGKYLLQFYYQVANNSGGATLVASLGGQQLFSEVNPASHSYVSFSTVYTQSAAGNVTLQFDAQNDASITNLDDITLTFLSPLGLAPLLPANAPVNVVRLVGALDSFVANGGTLPAGFQNLYNLSGQTLVDALTQLTGEAGASGGVQAASQMTSSFLTMLLNGFAGGRGLAGGFGAAPGYAPAPMMSADAADAYAAFVKAAPRRTSDGWTMWGSAYGGQSNAKGDASVGSNDTRATTWGLAAGFDRRVSPSTVVGLAFGGGSTNWNLGNGLGRGRGEVFQTGAYASHQIGAAYVSAAATYAFHDMTTDRTVTVAGTDRLHAGFDAHNVGARVETGWRFLAPGGAVGVTPYAAAQVQAVFLPGYSESATTGSNQFALAFNARTATGTRTELGFWFDTRALMGEGAVNLFSRLAWAHDWRNDPTVTAAFQSLTGTSFVVGGAAPPNDVGLVTAGIEAKATRAITVSAKFDGEFAQGYQSYAGTGTVRYTW